MNRKTATVLLIAVICGLGAMIASSRMLAGGEPAAETQQILLAARDLNAEEVLKPELVKLETVAKSAVPPGAFTSFRDVADRWVQIRTLEGEAIVDRKLAAKGSQPGLVARIPKGKRAFTITVNEQTGVSGFIQVDHRVDVFQVKTPAPGEPTRAIPVLEDLLVLASGTNTQASTDRTVQVRTVTVAVTPEEAAILTVAQSRGQLSLALRAMNDHELANLPEPPEPEIPQVVMAPPPRAPEPEPKPAPKPEAQALATTEEAPARYVTIYRGVRGSERKRVDRPEDDEAGLGFPSANDLAAPPSPGVANPPTPAPVPR
jgi:pilus assembly protein CpaB